MKVGMMVSLRMVKAVIALPVRAVVIVGMVEAISPASTPENSNPKVIRCRFDPAPKALQRLLRQRGIFTHDWELILFKDHAGTWTDTTFMKQWTVRAITP